MTQHDQADFAHRFAQTDDVRLHFVECGHSGSPMVLLHGIGMDWRVWQAVSVRLLPHFHLYIPDLRGHGQSEKPEAGYSLADYSSDVEQLLEQLGLKDVTLVGSSLGGMVAIVVEAATEVVSRRVLVDPPLVRGSGPQRPLFEEIFSIKQSNDSKLEKERRLFEILQAWHPGAGNAFLRYMAESWMVCATGVVREALSPIETREAIEASLTTIDSPTLILRGNADKGSVLRAEDSARSIGLMRQGEEKYFPRSGHAIHGTEPGAFVEAILEFRKVPVGAAA